MASAKAFMGNTCISNKKAATSILNGSKHKIIECDVKETPSTKEPCIAIKVQKLDAWLRVSPTNLRAISAKFGDDTDKWVGKTVAFQWIDKDVMGSMQKELKLTPA